MPTQKSRISLPHLRTWRMERLLTQQQLADASGIGVATVIRAEKGLPVNGLTAVRLAKALKITQRQLVESEPE